MTARRRQLPWPAMRIYISGVQHESSSFSPIPTSFRSFEQWSWTPDKPHDTDGFGYGEACRLAEAVNMEVVAGPFFNAEPSSPATATAWRQIREHILDGLRAAMPVDIVLLCLHGAQMADGVDDCEGALLGAARGIIGPGVAMGVLLDLHANVTSAMCTHADLTVSCREYPHIDYAERAEEMLPVLRGVAEGAIRPITRARRIPASGVFPTPDEPMRSFVIRITNAQRRPSVLMVSANHGFEGSDAPFTGVSVVVTTDNDEGLAEQMANEIATDVQVMSVRDDAMQALFGQGPPREPLGKSAAVADRRQGRPPAPAGVQPALLHRARHQPDATTHRGRQEHAALHGRLCPDRCVHRPLRRSR